MILFLQCFKNINVVPKNKKLGGVSGMVPGGVGEEIGVNMIKIDCLNAWNSLRITKNYTQ